MSNGTIWKAVALLRGLQQRRRYTLCDRQSICAEFNLQRLSDNDASFLHTWSVSTITHATSAACSPSSAIQQMLCNHSKIMHAALMTTLRIAARWIP